MSVQIDAVIAGIDDELARVRNDLADELLRELAANTPVDTGEAQGGWQRSGELTLAGDRGLEVSIDNPVDHVEFLAQGSSPQAPSGWIEATVERVAARHQAEVQSREVRL